jgi:hypothetical protein
MAHRPMAYVLKCGLAGLLILAAGLVCLGNQSASAEDQAGQAVSETTVQQGSETGAMDCQQLTALIQQQKTLISRETGQIKREIAALRDDVSKPGVKEIFAGIGYIFGLAGIGLYVHSRRTSRK